MTLSNPPVLAGHRRPGGLRRCHGGCCSADGFDRTAVARTLRAFGGLPTMTMEDGTLVADALDLAERGMDFADALHVVRSAHCERVVTLDRKLEKAAAAARLETVSEA